MSASLIATLVSLLVLSLLITLIMQIRGQRMATEALLEDSRIRTRLYQDADESTSLILSRTIENISDGRSDANLSDDSFALKVVRELVKRQLPKKHWLEIQSNERLVHELFVLLRDKPVSPES